MSSAVDEITIGDDMTDLIVVVTDADDVARDITGWTARLFIQARTSGHRPASAGALFAVASCTTTVGLKTLSRASGSFIDDGVVEGMLVFGSGIPLGAYVANVAASVVTMSLPATSTGTITATFWFGIAGSITAAPTGEITFAALGSYLDIGALPRDVYVGKIRAVDGASAEIGWSNSGIGFIEFAAVQPGAGT